MYTNDKRTNGQGQTMNEQIPTVQKTIVTNRDTNAVAVVEEQGRMCHVFNMDRNGAARGLEHGDYVISDGSLWRAIGYGDRRPNLRWVRELERQAPVRELEVA